MAEAKFQLLVKFRSLAKFQVEVNLLQVQKQLVEVLSQGQAERQPALAAE